MEVKNGNAIFDDKERRFTGVPLVPLQHASLIIDRLEHKIGVTIQATEKANISDFGERYPANQHGDFTTGHISTQAVSMMGLVAKLRGITA